MFPVELRMRTSKLANKPDIKPRMIGHRQDHSDATLLKRLDKLQKSENLNIEDDGESDDEFTLEEDDDVEEDLDYVQNYYDDDYNAFDDDADEGPTM